MVTQVSGGETPTEHGEKAEPDREAGASLDHRPGLEDLDSIFTVGNSSSRRGKKMERTTLQVEGRQ